MELFIQLKDLVKKHLKKDHKVGLRRNKTLFKFTDYVRGLFYAIMHVDADEDFKIEFVRAVYHLSLSKDKIYEVCNKYSLEHVPELGPVKDLIAEINYKLTNGEITEDDLRKGFRQYDLYNDSFYVRIDKEDTLGSIGPKLRAYITIEKGDITKWIRYIDLIDVDLDFKLKKKDKLTSGVVYDRVYLEGKIHYFNKRIVDEDGKTIDVDHSLDMIPEAESMRKSNMYEEEIKPISWASQSGYLDIDTINAFKGEYNTSGRCKKGDPDFYALMIVKANADFEYSIIEDYADFVMLELHFTILKDPYNIDQLTFNTGEVNCVIMALAERLAKKRRITDTLKLFRAIEHDFMTVAENIELGVTIPELLAYKAKFQPNMAVVVVDALGDVIKVAKADVEGKDTFNIIVQCGAGHCGFIDKDIRIDRIVSDSEFGYQMQINTFDISIDVNDICAKEYIQPILKGYKDDKDYLTSREPIQVKSTWSSRFINGAQELYYTRSDPRDDPRNDPRSNDPRSNDAKQQQRLILVKSIYPVLKSHKLNITKINTMRNDIIGVKIAKVTDEQIKQDLTTHEILNVILRYIDPSQIKIKGDCHKVRDDYLTIEDRIENWNKSTQFSDDVEDEVVQFIRTHTQNCYLEDALIIKDNNFICRLKFCRLLFEKTGNPRFKEFKGQSFGSLFKMLIPDFRGTPNNQVDYLLRHFQPKALVQYSSDLITGVEYEGLDINRAYTSVLYTPESKIPMLTSFDELHEFHGDKVNPDFHYLINPVDLDILFNCGEKLHIDASLQTGTTIIKLMKHGLKLSDITHEIRYTQYLDKDYFKKYVELMYEISEQHLKDKSKYECDAVKYQYNPRIYLDSGYYDTGSTKSTDFGYYDNGATEFDEVYQHFVHKFGYPVTNVYESNLMAKQAINEYTGLLGQKNSYTNRAGLMTTAEKYAMDKPGQTIGDNLKSYTNDEDLNIIRNYEKTPLVQHCLGAYVSIVSQGIGKLIDLIDEATSAEAIKIMWVKVDCVHYVHMEDGDSRLAGVNLERLKEELENPQQKPVSWKFWASLPEDDPLRIDREDLLGNVKFVTRLEDIGKYKREIGDCHARSSLFRSLDLDQEPKKPEIPELKNRIGYIMAGAGYGKTWYLMQLLHEQIIKPQDPACPKFSMAIAEENSMITNMQSAYLKANPGTTPGPGILLGDSSDRCDPRQYDADIITIDKFLGNVYDDSGNKTETTTTKELIKKYTKLDYLFIDEFANVSRDKWNKLISLSIACGFQIIAAGDPRQCTPPGDSSDRRDPRQYDADYHINVTKMQMFYEYTKLEYLEECARYKPETKAILDDFISGSRVPDRLLSHDMQMFNIVYTNKMRVYVNQLVSNELLNDEMRVIRYHSTIDKVYYNIAKGSVLLNKGRVNKSTFWTVEEIDSENARDVTLTSEQPITDPLLDDDGEPVRIKITLAALKACYVLGYAATVNSVQGKTVRCKYAIVQCDMMDKNRFYTALSRCEDINKVTVDCCICKRDWIKSIKRMPDYIPKYTESFIYAISYKSGKWYIGKTTHTTQDERKMSAKHEYKPADHIKERSVHYRGSTSCDTCQADEIIENKVIWSGMCTGKEILDIETYYIHQYVKTYGDLVTNIQKVKEKVKEKYEAKTKIEIKTTKEVKIDTRDRTSQGKGKSLICRFTLDRVRHEKEVAFRTHATTTKRTQEQAKAEIQQWLNALGKELNATLVLID